MISNQWMKYVYACLIFKKSKNFFLLLHNVEKLKQNLLFSSTFPLKFWLENSICIFYKYFFHKFSSKNSNVENSFKISKVQNFSYILARWWNQTTFHKFVVRLRGTFASLASSKSILLDLGLCSVSYWIACGFKINKIQITNYCRKRR